MNQFDLINKNYQLEFKNFLLSTSLDQIDFDNLDQTNFIWSTGSNQIDPLNTQTSRAKLQQKKFIQFRTVTSKFQTNPTMCDYLWTEHSSAQACWYLNMFLSSPPKIRNIISYNLQSKYQPVSQDYGARETSIIFAFSHSNQWGESNTSIGDQMQKIHAACYFDQPKPYL